MYLYLYFEIISSLLKTFLTLFLRDWSDSYSFCTFTSFLVNKPSLCGVGVEAYSRKANLYYYMAGLIEGDGSFNVPKIIKDSKGKKRGAGIEITGNLKDKPAYDLLKSKFGGNVYCTKGNKSVRWMIKDLKSVINIVNNINGKLRTPKIIRFHNMIDFLNLFYGTNISKLPLDNSPLFENAWLAGFIDSDGCFAIKGFTGNLRTYIAVQFLLTQRKLDISGVSMLEIMKKISSFLECPLKSKVTTLNNKEFEGFIVTTSNKNSNQIMIDYLKSFHLLTSKYLDFKCFERANYLYFNKLHRDPVFYEEIRLLKSSMNNSRTEFNWSHLEQYKDIIQ
jgi:intein/homing endonuclease